MASSVSAYFLSDTKLTYSIGSTEPLSWIMIFVIIRHSAIQKTRGIRCAQCRLANNATNGDDAFALWRRVIKTPSSWCSATTCQTGRRTISANRRLT